MALAMAGRARPRATGLTRAWLLIAAMAALALAVAPRVVGTTGIPHHELTLLLAIVVGFVVTESFVAHLTVGRQAHSFTFSDMPLVAGLLFVSPLALILARIVGTGLALVVVRRQSAVKVVFNLTQYWLGTSAAIVVCGAMGPIDPASQRTWFGALAGALVSATMSGLVINVVIRIVGERRDAAFVVRTVVTGLVTAFANASFVLVAINVVDDDWRRGWALVSMAGFLALAQRAHVQLQRRHNALERLNGFAGRLGHDLQAGAIVHQILVGAVETMDCATARLQLCASADVPARVFEYDGTSVALVEPGSSEADVALDAPPLGPTRDRFGAEHKTNRLSAVLSTHDGVIGRLTVTSNAPVPTFGDDEEHLLHAIAQHASVALTNGRLADELRTQVAENEHQATHDPLTRLPNRLLFERVVAALLERGRPLAVLLLDLDRFKEVNDTLGHAAGDALLMDAGARLTAAVPSAICIARLGGDEFTILLATGDAAEATRAADAAREALLHPLEVHSVPVSVDASVGIALAPQHGRSCDELLRHADVAMYAAKEGRGTSAVYDTEIDHNDASRLALVAELREAIATNALTLAYQPQVTLTGVDGAASVEALVRWNHPTRGMVLPDEFIPVAEQTGVIVDLTDWVLDATLRQCRTWLDDGLDAAVAVNISARVLRDVTFPGRLADLLAAHHVPPSRLTLEITESAIMADIAHAADVLWRLRRGGVRLSIDDLGVGHSSLAYLKSLPVHEVKIDKSFVLTMTDDPADDAIVCAVVGLAHRLDMTVVAEGVETARVRDRLVEIGCDVAQGFYYARPMPAAEVTAWFAAYRQRGPRTAMLRVAT